MLWTTPLLETPLSFDSKTPLVLSLWSLHLSPRVGKCSFCSHPSMSFPGWSHLLPLLQPSYGHRPLPALSWMPDPYVHLPMGLCRYPRYISHSTYSNLDHSMIYIFNFTNGIPTTQFPRLEFSHLWFLCFLNPIFQLGNKPCQYSSETSWAPPIHPPFHHCLSSGPQHLSTTVRTFLFIHIYLFHNCQIYSLKIQMGSCFSSI